MAPSLDTPTVTRRAVDRVLAVLPAEAWASVDYLAEKAGLRLSTVADVLVWMRGRGMARNERAVWQRVTG